MSLKSYKRKRDFKITNEPHGQTKKSRSKKSLTFVVQEHHARSLHYDFRLEWQGALKSWAIPKGPSMDPHVKRLAVEVEDHPLNYAHFEGTIPKGQYGAGEVYIWDHGTWHPDIDVEQGLRKGHLAFELRGKKLRGHWDLIRTKSPGKNQQWLLIKKEDAQTLSPHKKIKNAMPVRKKSLRKIKTKFIHPELAQLSKTVPIGREWIHEIKFDGYRIQAHIQNHTVKLFSRSGQDWTDKFPELANEFERLNVDSAIIDGEAVILDQNGRSNFQLLQASLDASSANSVLFYAFDLLFYNSEDLRRIPLGERKRKLKALLKTSLPKIRYSQEYVGNGNDLLQAAKQHQLEGIISKRRNSFYQSGRNPNWQKIKIVKEQEFVVGGYTEGRQGRGPIGALLLGVYKNNQLQYVGKVGSGFTQKSLGETLSSLKKLKQKNSPFELKSPNTRSVTWVTPQVLAKVSFIQWTDDEILRSPVFKGFRTDKSSHQVIKEELLDPSDINSISHPEKIIFRAEKLTKLDIASYYSKVSKRMIPLIANRPLSLVRCPNGTSGHCFFQKHPSHITASMNTHELFESNGLETYISIFNTSGLVDLVQMNAFEIHCSNATGESFETPDQIVMDLDPGPGIPWKKVIQAAFDLRRLLQRLHLQSFVKLSGGKGLHIHIPIRPIYSWEQVASFSQVLAQHLEDVHPDLYVSKMSKSLRTGKIFIDYFRNSQHATAVAPYSLRAQPHSAVALPISWEQLRKTSSGNQFSLPKALEHVSRQKSNPWKKFLQLKQRIHLLDTSAKIVLQKNHP